MGLLKTLFTNCAHPKGRMGRAMLRFMNLCHATLTNWGLSLVEIKDGWTMLDIGCGGGATLRRLLKRSNGGMVYGIDISEESVAKARKVNADVLDKQVFVAQGSAEKLPYEDWKFDLVTAVETVYFWPNLPDCLQEVRRVLKPGGKFAIMVEVALQQQGLLCQSLLRVSSNSTVNYAGSDEGYSGDIRTKESSSLWDEEW